MNKADDKDQKAQQQADLDDIIDKEMKDSTNAITDIQMYLN